MLAQKRFEQAPSVTRRRKARKRVGLLRRIIGNPMACVLLLAAVATFVLIVYVGEYAEATKRSYEKSALQAEHKAIEMQNDALRSQLEGKRSPAWVDSYAAESGMQQPSKMVYVKPSKQPAVARNVEDLD